MTPSKYQARRARRNAPPPERTRLPPPVTTKGNQLAAALERLRVEPLRCNI